MTLRRLIGSVKDHEKELAVFNTIEPDQLREELAAYFETRNVQVRTERTASGRPVEVAVLSTDGEVLEVLDADLLRGLLDHSPDTLGVADTAYEPLLRHLNEPTFTACDTGRLRYTAREIEDRARRMGRGQVHTGLQRCSVIGDQRGVYTDLAARGLDVHAYAVADVPPPELEGVRVHTAETDEIATTWLVVYDGGGDDAQKTALLAEERGTGRFCGVWTYDPEIVDAAVTHLERTYIDGPHPRSGP